jgi:hypothetical protein
MQPVFAAGERRLCVKGQDGEWGFTDGQKTHGIVAARMGDAAV